MPLRTVFMGPPPFAVPVLRAVTGAHEVAAVYTQPPRVRGRRGGAVLPTAVHAAAHELDLPVRHPLSLKNEGEQAAFAALGADVAVVVAYGLILPQAILDAPRASENGHGCLNGHASLLPRWRGAAPIQRAIMAGDRETGVCIMGMERGLDTGPVALSEAVPITPETTGGALHDRLRDLAARLMVEALDRLEAGTLHFTPQPDEGVTYASKIDKNETRIDWSRPAEEVHRHVMALSPAPGAWCEVPKHAPAGHEPPPAERVRVLETAVAPHVHDVPGLVTRDGTVACGGGGVRIVRMQRAGGKALDERATAQSWRVPERTVLPQPA